VHHAEVVLALEKGLEERGLRIDRWRYAVGGSVTHPLDHKVYPDVKLFGVADLQTGTGTFGSSIGFRSSNAQDFAISIIAGARVFVCDNLCFDGANLVLNRKHTTGLDLYQEVREGLDRWQGADDRLRERIARMEHQELPDVLARAGLFRLFERKALPHRLLPHVATTYFQPEDGWSDVRPRTVWGLHNAVTRTIRDEPLHLRGRYSQATTRELAAFYKLN